MAEEKKNPFATEWLPGYIIITRRGGYAWQVGIVQDQKGKRRVRVATGRMTVENDPNGVPVASVKQSSKINITSLEEWDKINAEVRKKLQELADLKREA